MWICINSHDQGNSQTDWLTVRSGHGILIYSAWQVLNYHLLSPYLELCWCYWYKQPHLYYLFTVICLFPALLLIYHQHEEQKGQTLKLPTDHSKMVPLLRFFIHASVVFICAICFIIVCSASLPLLVTPEGCTSRVVIEAFPGYLHSYFFTRNASKGHRCPCLKNLNSNC